MLKFTGTFEALGGKVLFKKCKIRGGRFLYSFKSEEKAVSEQHAYFGRAHKKGLDPNKIKEKMLLFGVVVFESDVDLDPSIIYHAYEDRWLIELLFKRYNSDECLDRTNVQGDFSVIGSEFINFVATVLTSRILDNATKARVLDKLSLGDLLDDLASAWRKTDAPLNGLPKRGDRYWQHTLEKVFDELEALGLLDAPPKNQKSTRASKGGKKSKSAKAVNTAVSRKSAKNKASKTSKTGSASENATAADDTAATKKSAKNKVPKTGSASENANTPGISKEETP